MDVIVVTPPDYFAGEGALINQLFKAGLQVLHLRKPANNALQFRSLMLDIDPAWHHCIALHQHHDLADEFALRRLHFTEDQRKLKTNAQLDELLGEGFRLSSSVHELHDLAGLVHFDYVFFGPVFDSISKQGYQSVLHANFKLPAHEVKVFAIGGVSAKRIASLQKMGFDGFCLLGMLWHQADDPVKAFKNLLQTLKEIN